MKKNASKNARILNFEIPPVSIYLVGSDSKNRRRVHYPRIGHAVRTIALDIVIILGIWLAAGIAKEVCFNKTSHNWVDAPVVAVEKAWVGFSDAMFELAFGD